MAAATGLKRAVEKLNKHVIEAYGWLNVAAARGLKRAAEKRDKIEKDMTPKQISKGQERSREILKSIV